MNRRPWRHHSGWVAREASASIVCYDSNPMIGVGKWLLLLTLVGCLASCGPRREYIYVNETPGTVVPAAVVSNPAPSPEPVDPAASSKDRCERVCFRIGSLSGGLINQPWLLTCVRSCHEHASEGQLACYERVERVADLEACTVR